MDGNETDDGKGEEIGIDRDEKGGGRLEFTIPAKLVFGELLSCSFYFFLHEKKFFHSSKFLGISGSCENPTNVVDREA